MRVAIMSDSHDNLGAIVEALKIIRSKNIDALIHLGDMISPFTFVRLVELPIKIIVILGNNDGDKLQLKEIAMRSGAILKEQPYELNLNGRKILAIHGFGSKELTRNLVYTIASSGIYDIVLYGHTHELDIRTVNKTLVINPGEVCGYLSGKRTFVILDLAKLEYEVIEI